ncbi:hypothetical protein Bsp3421_001274 [Burkholderia sp. FERM BP-3421]|jgi:hypothetical protein|uniref:hypothetical protein n=1 Tax=Burkholderia sp. FERM BP-3421 TaxID=1494466 RepID=UPI002362B31A|nr:hypothetical protein [Burkholderia sp. FERM BP-3421]WDD91366.1 hypothetical protein Bsp3421_001274 [Burkholderia sp. FERM BP-3421]
MNWRGRAALLGATLCALVTGGARAQSAPVRAGDAPPAWVAYAQQVSARLHAALDEDNADAQRFYAFFEQRAAGQPRIELPISTWLDAHGRVTRVEWPPLDDPQAEAALRALLLRQAMASPPPRGMRQPIVVRFGFAAQ